jgi:Domain of unknown function (DUF4917)
LKPEQLHTYDEVLASTPNTKHILLGNGFSISCNKVFQYNNIYEFAKNHGLAPRVLELFKHFGTTNFELIARALGDTIFIGELYELIGADQKAELEDGINQIKSALVSAIAQTHLATPDGISDESRLACVQFLKPYKSVFTTNYDLLLYWVSMQGLSDKELNFEDGFRSSMDDPDAKYVVFSDHLGSRNGLFYLHGALHLFEQNGEVRKHCWNRSGVSITDNVISSLEENNFPLFVSEGDSTKKLETIQRSGYLSYCYQKLQRQGSTLVVCGRALGDSDEHILRAIGDADYTTVWLGVYGDAQSDAAKRMEVIAVKLDQRRKKNKNPKTLEVKFYDVRTAPIWGAITSTAIAKKLPSLPALPARVAKKA